MPTSFIRHLRFIGILAAVLLSQGAFAQTDSTEYTTEDIIYLEDGRILHGEIISFDEASGTIVFKDNQGLRYSFGRSEYKYFKEDEVIEVNGRGQRERVLHPRKNSGFDIQLGFSGSSQAVTHTFKADDYHLSTWDTPDDIAAGIRIGLGLQVDSVHYIGAAIDLSFMTYNKSFNQMGLRYVYRYPAPKRNAAFYLPLEAKYSSTVADLVFEVPHEEFSWQTDNVLYDITVTSWELSLGQGVQWGLPNKRAVSAEVAIFRHFNLEHEYGDVTPGQQIPDSEFSTTGVRFALFYHL